MRKEIIILGSTGMLGRYMSAYLGSSYECVGLNKSHFCATSSDVRFLEEYINSSDIVINCVGVLKPYITRTAVADTIKINSVFPQLVADICEKHGAKMIHISSDCIFSGVKGAYVETDVSDANDIYAKTKCIEPPNALTLRTSFIGEDINTDGVGFLQWLTRMKNSSVVGYSNCLWNGVTCLEFARIVKRLIQRDDTQYDHVRHVFGPDIVSKYQLCKMVNDVYDLNIKISRKSATNISGTPIKHRLDRTLATIHDDTCISKAPLIEQIQEQRDLSFT